MTTVDPDNRQARSDDPCQAMTVSDDPYFPVFVPTRNDPTPMNAAAPDPSRPSPVEPYDMMSSNNVDDCIIAIVDYCPRSVRSYAIELRITVYGDRDILTYIA